MNITLLLIVALLALALAGLVSGLLGQKDATLSSRPKRHKGFLRTWRKVYLLPIGIHRLTGWLPGQKVRPQVQFANIGEGDYEHGLMPLLPDAATGSRYLLYKRGSDNDHCAICGAGDDPLGPSDDQAATGYLDVPITIKLLGAFKGTSRVVTDGTLANGDYVKCGASGQATKASTGDLSFGRAVIRTDMSSAAGDVITIIPAMPAKYAF